MARMLWVAIAVGLVLGLSPSAEGAACGGSGQRPCRIWERIPSCDPGLVEHFRAGKCASSACGAKDQRPCQIFERLPSCNPGLAEDFSQDKCVGSGESSWACGKENGKACKIWERIPSCDPGLLEDLWKGICLRPEQSWACGGLDRKPCRIWERIPSCNPGLVEHFRSDTCASRICGGAGQRPCQLWERIPSCDRGLSEDFLQDRCVQGLTPQVTAELGRRAQHYLTTYGPMLERVMARVASDAPGSIRDQVRRGVPLHQVRDPAIEALVMSTPVASSPARHASLVSARATASAASWPHSISVGLGLDASLLLGYAGSFECAGSFGNDAGRPDEHRRPPPASPGVHCMVDHGPTLGASAGGEVAVPVGLWWPSRADLCGKALGITFGLKVGAGASVSVYFACDSRDPLGIGEFEGFSLAPGVGASAEIGEGFHSETRYLAPLYQKQCEDRSRYGGPCNW